MRAKFVMLIVIPFVGGAGQQLEVRSRGSPVLVGCQFHSPAIVREGNAGAAALAGEATWSVARPSWALFTCSTSMHIHGLVGVGVGKP